eukprot:5874643-Pleurochrysis_carterae.AAC.3
MHATSHIATEPTCPWMTQIAWSVLPDVDAAVAVILVCQPLASVAVAPGAARCLLAASTPISPALSSSST